MRAETNIHTKKIFVKRPEGRPKMKRLVRDKESEAEVIQYLNAFDSIPQIQNQAGVSAGCGGK